MRKVVAVFAVAAAVTLGLLVPRGPAAPALGEKPARWEYAELKYTRTFVFPAVQPGAAKGPAVPRVSVVWSTADDEMEATEWEDLAGKMKAPAGKKDGSTTAHRLRVLNRLGADGWEVMEHTATENLSATATWAFKRRLP